MNSRVFVRLVSVSYLSALVYACAASSSSPSDGPTEELDADQAEDATSIDALAADAKTDVTSKDAASDVKPDTKSAPKSCGGKEVGTRDPQFGCASQACSPCVLNHATDYTCSATDQCAAKACETNFGDCDSVPLNGCETDTSSSLNHCGACGKVCVPPSNGTVSCKASACVIQCDQGFVSCAEGCCLPPIGFGQLELGDRASCFVTDGGALKCWGQAGMIGGYADGGFVPSSATPVDVAGFSNNVAQVSVGRNHACAVTTSGGVKCWGSNYKGLLGNDSTISNYSPVDVVGLSSGVAKVAAGHTFSCALLKTGSVKCWGQNYNGVLGTGATIPTESLTPVDVVGVTDAVDLVAGYGHACVLTKTAGVKCWGTPSAIALTGNAITLATAIPNLSAGVISLAAGQSDTYAVMIDGTVRSAGGGVAQGISNAIQVTADYQHRCVLTKAGGVLCWGSDTYGQLGNGGFNTSLQVQGIASGAIEVRAGDWHTCARMAAGGIKCWGMGLEGQLGNGGKTNMDAPVSVVGL